MLHLLILSHQALLDISHLWITKFLARIWNFIFSLIIGVKVFKPAILLKIASLDEIKQHQCLGNSFKPIQQSIKSIGVNYSFINILPPEHQIIKTRIEISPGNHHFSTMTQNIHRLYMLLRSIIKISAMYNPSIRV